MLPDYGYLHYCTHVIPVYRYVGRYGTEHNIYVRYVKDTYQAMFARVQILASRLEKARSLRIGYL
jgi:hypothetical protein